MIYIKLLDVYQDGGRFYSEHDNHLIMAYDALVSNDNDIEGARCARKAFAIDYPHFVDYIVEVAQ